uniref:Sjogrens syndrome scleroderma autoantigen 1 n=1 Tax=Strongyloides papillosus TaxID=174720 RepID=A0A0N5BBE0_STREA
MGEMILQGYSMLDECCPNCNNVLLANRRNEKGCVACAMRIMKETEIFGKAEEKDRSERSNVVELEKTRIVREESEKIKGVVKVPEKSLSDRISAKMGDLLIKGHRMLDEYCPTCSCVLMEDPNTSDKSCIACQLSDPAPGKPIVVKEVKNEISLISNQGVDSKLVTTPNKGCIDFKNSQHIALQSVAARLQHTSSIVGDSTLPISPQDILINLEIIKECLNILKEFGPSA